MKFIIDPSEVLGLDTLLLAKQNKLSAGTGIIIGPDNVISATAGGNNTPYILPTASATVLGGVKVGANLTITNGVLSANSTSYTLPIASSSALGGVKIGAGINLSTDGTISISTSTSTGPTTFPTIYNLPKFTWAQEYRPNDYLVTYNNGTQQGAYFTNGYEQSGLINNSNRPDNVFWIAAYNMTPQGNRILSTDGGWTMRIETHYDIPGFPESFEPHIWGYTDYAGNTHRSLSGYFSKKSGQGFWNFEANSLTAMIFRNNVRMDYWSVGGGTMNLASTDNGVGIHLTHTETNRVSSWSCVGGVSVFNLPAAPGFSTTPLSLSYSGYGSFQLTLTNYTNDAAAKADGRKVGDWYFRNITLSNGEIIEVVTKVN